MDISIIIVSWNVKEKLRKCLTNLFLSRTNFSFEVLVVDNNSGDGSAEMVRGEFGKVKLIANAENLGFAKAVNQAFRQATGEFIFLLNPDNFVFSDTVDNLLSWLQKNNQAAIAGCRLVDAGGDDIAGQVRKFPELFDQLAIVLKWPYLLPKILNKYLCLGFDYNKSAPVDSVRGSAMVIRRSALEKFLSAERLKNGELLDERFFIWFEDVDICRACRDKNLEVWYVSEAKCYDQVGQSFTQLPRLRAQKLFRASMLAYFKKWKPLWQYWILYLAWPIGMTIAYIFTTLRFKKKDNT
jgi:GT2 family glycosyltransferase